MDKTMDKTFRQRFDDYLSKSNSSKYLLPDQKTYQELLSGLLRAGFYYEKKKYEVLDVGGLKKIIKVRIISLYCFLRYIHQSVYCFVY